MSETEISPLERAVQAGRALGKLALYFGCWERAGHFLHRPGGRTIYDAQREVQGFPWSDGLMDSGLLKNGKRPDNDDGKVFWTCGGLSFWYAFFWWDNSVDRRGASNSGFYVRGFGWPEAQSAFDYACAEFPTVVFRQKHALILQNPNPPQRAVAASPSPMKEPRNERDPNRAGAIRRDRWPMPSDRIAPNCGADGG